MVKKTTFRTMCYVIGFLGLIIIIVAKVGKMATILGVLMCIFLIAFGFFVTSPWAKYLIGEPTEPYNPSRYGSMGD